MLVYVSNNQEICDGWGMWHIRETRKLHTGFWWGDRLEDLGMDEDSIKMDPQEVG
jgi:hypothetical protein